MAKTATVCELRYGKGFVVIMKDGDKTTEKEFVDPKYGRDKASREATRTAANTCAADWIK